MGGRHAMPVAVIVGILPIVKQVLTEFIGIRIAIEKSVSIIAAECKHLCVRA
ncbi:hypothetical protein D1872_226430 [compost metagenome]